MKRIVLTIEAYQVVIWLIVACMVNGIVLHQRVHQYVKHYIENHQFSIPLFIYISNVL